MVVKVCPAIWLYLRHLTSILAKIGVGCSISNLANSDSNDGSACYGMGNGFSPQTHREGSTTISKKAGCF